MTDLGATISPTSEFGKKTKSTPFGTADAPFNPLGLVIGANTSFVARSVDVFQQHLKETLGKTAAHKGSAYVEILQNCNIFNDGAWFDLTEKDARVDHVVHLEHGKPLIFGKNRDKGIRLNGMELEVVHLGNGNGLTEKDLLIHDETNPNPAYAFLLGSDGGYAGLPRPPSASCAPGIRIVARTPRPARSRMLLPSAVRATWESC